MLDVKTNLPKSSSRATIVDMYRLILMLFTAFVCRAGIIENISWVESGDDDRAIGRSGELSRWQVMESVRKSYPNVLWGDYAQARRCVVQELNQRSARFMQVRGRWPTEYEQALIWRCPNRVRHPTKADREYARRVAGL